MTASALSELSILIVTWKGDDLLKNCLDSLKRACGDVPEIVVVDNANLGTTKALVAAYPNAAYVAAPENLGFAGGNNLGLPLCTRPHVLLLNNDTVIHTDSFTPLVAFLRDHPKVGVVQGTMNIPGFGLDDCGTVMTPFGIQWHLNRGKPTATTALAPRRVFAAKGAMLMFKREVLQKVGFLFYDHFKSYYEETDFCHRVRLAGYQIWFVPTPPIDHLCGRTSGRFNSEEIFAQYFRNILFSFHHNFGLFGHIFTIPCFMLAAFVKSPKALIRAVRMSWSFT